MSIIPDSDAKIIKQSSRANYYAPSAISPLAGLNDHDISDVADSLNFLLTELDTPKSVRLLLQALLGLLAGRKTVVQFYQFDLAKRLYYLPYISDPEEFKKLRESFEGKVQSAIKKLLDWRNGWENLPIKYTPGGRTEAGKKYPSEIQTPLLSWAAELLESVRSVEDFENFAETDRAKTFRDCARKLLKKKRVSRALPPQKPQLRQQTQQQIYGTLVSAAKRHTAKVLAQTKLPVDEVIHRLLIDLAGRLEAEFNRQGDDFIPLPEQAPPENFQLVSPGMRVDFPENQESQGGQLPPPCDSPIIQSDALSAVDIFASVGAYPAEILFKNDDLKTVESFQKRTPEQFLAQVEDDIFAARQAGESFIARLRGGASEQIDDCTAAETEFLRQWAFFAEETSRGNFQVWLAFASEEEKAATSKRLFDGLKVRFPGTKMNRGSNGATRWPGSINFKPGRDEFQVRIVHVESGRIVTMAELEAAGLLAQEKPKLKTRSESVSGAGARKPSKNWPSYQMAMAGADLKDDGTRDKSQADARFVTAAITMYRHTDRNRIAEKLREVSTHAGNDEPAEYAMLTVNRVADYLRDYRGVRV